MCCYALLQGIFPTYRSNPGLPHCRWIPYCLSHQGSPIILEWVSDPFSRGSSWPRNQTGVSCIAGRFFTSWATRWLSHQMMVPSPSPAPRMGQWHTSDLIRALYSPDHRDSFWDQVTSEVIPLNSLSLEPTNSIFVLAAPGWVSVTCNHKRTGHSSIGAECLWGCPRVRPTARMQKPHLASGLWAAALTEMSVQRSSIWESRRSGMRGHRMCAQPEWSSNPVPGCQSPGLCFGCPPVRVKYGLAMWLSGKESTCQCRRRRFDPRLRKISWKRKWQPTPVFLPRKSLGQRSLVCYSPRGHKESDATEQLSVKCMFGDDGCKILCCILYSC